MKASTSSTTTASNLWLTVWAPDTWGEFLRAGATTYGLPDKYDLLSKRVKQGDLLICYMSGRSEFFAVLEVLEGVRFDNTLIWLRGVYPLRFKVRKVYEPRYGVRALDLRDKLSLFRRLRNPQVWGNHFHSSIVVWTEEDAAAVLTGLAARNEGLLPEGLADIVKSWPQSEAERPRQAQKDRRRVA